MMVRVLHVINSIGGGGSEKSLVDLLPYFESEGIESVITCFRRTEDEVTCEEGRLDLRFFPEQNVLKWAARVRGLLRDEPFDLVHTSIFEADLAGRLAAVGMRVPVLTSLVNTSYEPLRLSDPNVSRHGLWAARMLDSLTARYLTTHFHALTHAVKEASMRALRIPAERITVVERGRDPVCLGVRTPERRQRARMMLGLAEDDEVLVNVGRQEYQKGQRDLLNALGRIVAARPRAKLLIAGKKGQASAELDRMRRELGLEDRVIFLGHRNDVPEILCSADLFVFPSLYEGAAGAVVEAMALGLPVVATDIPSLAEVVEAGRNALLVPPENPRSLADAVIQLMQDPARRREFGERSSEIFLSRFTLERSATRMINLYRSLVSFDGAIEYGSASTRSPRTFA